MSKSTNLNIPRRKFISLTSAMAVGGMLSLHTQKLKSQEQCEFKNKSDVYDVIINGSSLKALSAAVSAAKRGLKVLVIDKRPYLCGEITGTKKLWAKNENDKILTSEIKEILFPEKEASEIFREIESNCAKTDNTEILFLNGSLKKSLMRFLLENNVDTLLMSEPFGVFTDENNFISAISVATKHGIFAIKTNAFVDADTNNIFSRKLFSKDYKINSVKSVLHLSNARTVKKENLDISQITDIKSAILHCGKRCESEGFLEIEFTPKSNEFSEIEIEAKEIAAKNFSLLQKTSQQIKNARIYSFADECSFYIYQKAPIPTVKNFYIWANTPQELSASKILESFKSGVEESKEFALDTTIKEIKSIITSNGLTPVKSKFKKQVDDCGIKLPLWEIPIQTFQTINKKDTEILVAGGGTAGANAAMSASSKGVKVTVLEYFNSLGGSKTVGGVIGYYWGLSKHPLILEHKKNISLIKKTARMEEIPAKIFYHQDAIKKHSGNFFTGAIICGAKLENSSAKSVIACINSELFEISANIIIDATADADIANFLKIPFSIGDDKMRITQNYSQWDKPFKTLNGKITNYNSDLDLLDSSKITDFQRGLKLSHYEGSYYDFYPMLTVRESRRPEGVYQLTLSDIVRKKTYPDTISQAFSDYDPHFFSTSEFTRTAMLLQHRPLPEPLNIPYRSILPKEIDALLFSGRGISQTQETLQFTRMSADVETLGYVTGEIAAYALKTKSPLRNLDLSELQKSWVERKFLPQRFTISLANSPSDVVEKLAQSDSKYLLEACNFQKSEILPILETTYKKSANYQLACALAWFGNIDGIAQIKNHLNLQLKEQEKKPHLKNYAETYERSDKSLPYWKINSDIAFLALPKAHCADSEIEKLLEKSSCNDTVVFPKEKYYANRIDLCLVPNYNLLQNLCFYAQLNPSKSFAPHFERLLESTQLKNNNSSDNSNARWNAYPACLTLSIASAALQCGSIKGKEVLESYLTDCHYFFRNYASICLQQYTKKVLISCK